MGGDQPLFKGNRPDKIQEEGLSRTVFTDDKADAGTIIGYPFDIFDKSCDLVYPSNLDEVLAGTGHNPGA